MPQFDAVLFDLDGTLLDTAPDFYAILAQMQRQRGQTPVLFEELRSCASDGTGAMLKLAFGSEISCEELEPLAQEFLTQYESAPVAQGELFPGIAELLRELESESVPWGIVTNKPRYLSERVLTDLNLSQRCAVLICPEDVSKSKPSPEGLLRAADQLALDARKCLYLGDHQRDIEAGRAAGMTTLACAFGYLKPGESAQDWQADHLVESSDALPHLIRELLA